MNVLHSRVGFKVGKSVTSGGYGFGVVCAYCGYRRWKIIKQQRKPDPEGVPMEKLGL